MTLCEGSKLGPYEIIESIGSGGMGEVWKARDTRLGRIVAIKKVKEQHSERFKQEARSIAALNHPNICQIFDIGDDYLVLEYVEGKPLSSPQPEQEAVRLAIQIASALEEAHQHGIIHRDLKPPNILVTDKGSVKLLDFGLAKLYEQDQSISSLPTADMPQTQAGAILGTVAYMSPEQAQGKPADARSEIFSFGLVLYEMLSGRRAFSGDSASETVASLLRDEPAPLLTPPPLERIVKRCLEKQPSIRYQTMSAVKRELDKSLEEMRIKTSEEPQPSIAVLPFVDMSPGKDNEWFSDGLAEEIISALTKISDLQVIARTSAFAFKGKQEDIRKIAETLGVANILEGSVRKSGNRIRVTAQLIEASKGIHLWSERYDRNMTDVFEIQDDISQAIADKLRVSLSEGKTLIKHPTNKIEAYNLYLRGRYHFAKMTPENFAKSKEYYEQAIAVDSGYAPPWQGLAGLYSMFGNWGMITPKEANKQGRQAVLKALELDDNLPEAHGQLAIILASEYDWRGAEREFLKALEIGPGILDIWVQYGTFYLLPMGRVDEAVVVGQRALKMDPLAPMLHGVLGMRYICAKQYDRAIEQCLNALELDPHWPLAHWWLGLAYFKSGKIDDGIRELEITASVMGIPLYLGALGAIYAQAGRIVEARKIIEQLQELAEKKYVPSAVFGCIYYGLGETEKAFTWFEKMVDEHDTFMLFIFSYLSESLHSHSRFKALLRKMNLEP